MVTYVLEDVLWQSRESSKSPKSGFSLFRTKLCSLCQLQHCRKLIQQTSCQTPSTSAKCASLERLEGDNLDKPGQLLSSPFLPWAVLVYIQPQHCVSCATEAPPEQQGAELQPAESFLCELLQHWKRGEKRKQRLFSTPNESPKRDKSTLICFITSPVQARN